MARGRPTKLSPALQKKIVTTIRKGNYREVAACLVGLAPETLSRWMSRDDQPYMDFRQAVLEAEQLAEMRAVELIMRAAAKDANHAKWWLERKFPHRWGRKDRHEASRDRSALDGGSIIYIGGDEESYIRGMRQARGIGLSDGPPPGYRTSIPSLGGDPDRGDGEAEVR